MTGQIVSDLNLILLSDFIGYNPRSRKNALSRYRELSAIRHCCMYKHIYTVYISRYERGYSLRY